ncbi:putative leucine-rich repeat-containing protein DDB_G0290503 [Macrobrachium rosenbergii]|uniref:putative leucine-rich repeat-containing protein DDB_G0290503 n=1 Tax=Macrobrachium rosenbergii TaxID=79674 RepID=UPI0034D75B54
MDADNAKNSSESGNGLSELQETEQDSDGIWSTASEYKSDAESDMISTDSVSHELLTVRDKTALQGEDLNEIQQLISDAESLALERSQSISSGSPVADNINHCGQSAQNVTNSPREKKICPSQQTSFETDDSGYYGKGDVADEPQNASMNSKCFKDQGIPNSRESHQGVQNVETKQMRDGARLGPRFYGAAQAPFKGGYLSNSSEKANLYQDSFVPKQKAFVKHDPEEKHSVTKDVKEVCNSSIKECRETFEGDIPPRHSGGTTSALPSSNTQYQRFAAKEVSTLVHDECSNLLRLALTSTSNLGRITRLLRQVMTLQFGVDTPRVAESVQKELEDFERQHLTLQSQLNSETPKLQTTLSQVQALESTLMELQNESAAVEKTASSILQVVEETLSSCGLHHMIAVTSPRRRSVGRTLEDAESALALLLGELSRKVAHCKTLEHELQFQEQERESLQKLVTDKEARLLTLQRDLEITKEWGSSEISTLKLCLAQAEANAAEIRMDKERASEMLKRQNHEDKTAIKKLQKQLVDVQHSSDSRVSQLEGGLQELTKEKLTLESSLQEIRNNYSIQEQQINLMNEEHMMLVAGLRSTIKHQQVDIEKFRQQTEETLNEMRNSVHHYKDLENEKSSLQDACDKLQADSSNLMDRIRDLEQERKECELSLQSKINALAEIRRDLERQIRAKDLRILQLQTELRLDGTQINALTDDNSNLQQKVQNLQERLWEATRSRRRHGSNNSSRSSDDSHGLYGSSFGKRPASESGSVLNLLRSPEEGCQSSLKLKSLEKDISDGQSREEQLHKLIIEKDGAIKNLQNSLSNELAAKDKELETLRNKLPELEQQMNSLLAAIEVNEAMGHVTTEVGRRLQERQEHLENLNRSSNLLQDEYSSLAMENQILKNELSACKRSSAEYVSESSESSRKAREEARKERLNAARLEEECGRLQAQLKCTNAILEQERRERAMRDMVQQLKHEDFEAILDSTVSSNVDTL